MKLRHYHRLQLHVRLTSRQIEGLWIEASPSFVRETEGNVGAERGIRTSQGIFSQGALLG